MKCCSSLNTIEKPEEFISCDKCAAAAATALFYSLASHYRWHRITPTTFPLRFHFFFTLFFSSFLFFSPASSLTTFFLLIWPNCSIATQFVNFDRNYTLNTVCDTRMRAIDFCLMNFVKWLHSLRLSFKCRTVTPDNSMEINTWKNDRFVAVQRIQPRELSLQGMCKMHVCVWYAMNGVWAHFNFNWKQKMLDRKENPAKVNAIWPHRHTHISWVMCIYHVTSSQDLGSP